LIEIGFAQGNGSSSEELLDNKGRIFWGVLEGGAGAGGWLTCLIDVVLDDERDAVEGEIFGSVMGLFQVIQDGINFFPFWTADPDGGIGGFDALPEVERHFSRSGGTGSISVEEGVDAKRGGHGNDSKGRADVVLVGGTVIRM
jgi:hypothetical protein